MRCFVFGLVVLSSWSIRTGFAQELPQLFEGRVSSMSVAANSLTQVPSHLAQASQGQDGTGITAGSRFDLDSFQPDYSFPRPIIRAQSADGGGSGSGAAAATDPSVPLTQFQLQNSFIPSTYGADGYSNVFVVQPVIPLNLDWDTIPYHIIRPTLPVIAPTADPDGPMGVQGGLGDLTVIDVYVRPFEQIKTNIGIGPVVIVPTSTHSQLGLGEWQLGPTVFAVSKAVPKWNLGVLVQAPFSMESDAYALQVQPIVVRTLPQDWYVGSGDLLWTFDDQNGGYDVPLSARVGKVHKFGDHILNIFLQPQYTPRGFHSGGKAEWGIKLNVTFLLPHVKLSDPVLGRNGLAGKLD